MYRILIADDNPVIADHFSDLCKNITELEIDIYKFYSSEQSLQIFSHIRIDIYLASVYISGKNSIDLVSTIKHYWPRCKFIFLCERHDFRLDQTEYYKDGMDYSILNSRDDKLILATVRNVIFQIEEEFHTQQISKRLSCLMNSTKPILQRDYLLQILQSCVTYFANRRTLFEDLELPLNPVKPVLLMLGLVDSEIQPNDTRTNFRIQCGIQSIVEEFKISNSVMFPLPIESNRILWFTQPVNLNNEATIQDEERSVYDNLFHFIHKSLKVAQNFCRIILDVSISLYFSAMLIPGIISLMVIIK